MSCLAIIPGKGYSTRFGVCKVLAKFGTETLLRHAINAASPADEILVLTDSADIAGAACAAGVRAVVLDIAVESTVLDTLHKACAVGAFRDHSTLMLLLPTCPQRTAVHVEQALMVYEEQECDGVVSVCKTDWPLSLECGIDEDGSLIPAQNFLIGNTRQQAQPPSMRPNGGIYLRSRAAWDRDPNFFSGVVWPYFMPRAESADIDTRADLDKLNALG